MYKILLSGLVAGLLLISCQNENKKANNEQNAVENTTQESGSCFDIITETPYNIPAQWFDETAQALAHASGCFIETDLSKTGSVIVKPVKGKLSIRDAVQMAIKGTDLKITSTSPDRLNVELK